MWKFYIIPKNVSYVQNRNFLTWEQTDKIDASVPTVIVLTDSLATHYTKFYVCYKGKMQGQNGGGACANPGIPTFLDHNDPMDNSLLGPGDSKWTLFDWAPIYRSVIGCKYHILENMGYRNKIPYFYWNCKFYATKQFGLLIGILDGIGMGTISPSVLEEDHERFRLSQKALTA